MKDAVARLTCPACSGTKTARAVLCRICRARAIGVGISAVIRAHTLGDRPTSEERITPGQIRAAHGKAAKLDRHYGLARRTTHDRALVHASAILGRDVGSIKDLDELEANLILDWLDEQLVAIELATA